MQLKNDLVLLLCIVLTCILLSETVARNSNTKKNRNELIIYDPKSGQEMNPVEYLPIVVGNKRKPASPNGNVVELPKLWNPCSCGDLSCSCCLGVRFGDVFNNRICIIVRYIPADIAINLRINFNRRTLAQFGFSARNPPAYCVPILLPLPIAMCVRLYDIRALGGNVQVCVSLLLNILLNTAFEYQFDCIRFGVNGVRFQKRGQLEMEMETSMESEPNDEDDEFILKSEEEIRQSVQLEDDYSGISVEGERSMDVPIVRRGKRARK